MAERSWTAIARRYLTVYEAAPNGKLRVHGVDHDGDMLDAIVVLEDGVIVVTLFG